MKQKMFLASLLINIAVGVLFSLVLHISPMVGIGFILFLGIAKNKLKGNRFAFYVDLAPEVWTGDILDGFFPDTSFLSEATDFSMHVEADAINMAEVGADPTVLKNNTVYPVATADAADSPIRKVLDYYDTTSTVIRNAVAVELAYDQRSVYTKKHQRVLLQKIANDAANAYAPTSNATLTPVINASGDAANVILDRIIDLQTAYNNMNAPTEGRILVLHPNHLAIISKEDKALYKSFAATPGGMLFGFKIYQYTDNPIYITATGVKAAQGTAFVGGTHSRASFSFLKSEAMRAMGSIKMFSSLNDPKLKGDEFNFQVRAYVDKIRNKYFGAIYK